MADKIVAKVQLPDQHPFLRKKAVTSRLGLSTSGYTVKQTESNVVVFETLYTFLPNEQLIIMVDWPSGIIKEKVPFLKNETNQWIIVYSNFILLLLYCILTWRKFGRDPKAEPIHLEPIPPSGYAPAMVNFVLYNRARTHLEESAALVSTIVDFAVRGIITIEKQAKKSLFSSPNYVLHLKKKGFKGLLDYERRLLISLFCHEGKLEISKKNKHTLARALKDFELDLYEMLYANNYKKYFNNNEDFVFLAFVFSLPLLWMLGIMTTAIYHYYFTMEALLLTIFTAYFFIAIKNRMQHRKRILVAVVAYILTVVVILINMYLVHVIFSWHIVAVFLAVCCLLAVYTFIIVRPTTKGQALISKIKGYRLFLTLNKKNSYIEANTDAEIYQNFEKHLPYAIALHAEDSWQKQFLAKKWKNFIRYGMSDSALCYLKLIFSSENLALSYQVPVAAQGAAAVGVVEVGNL